MDTDTPQPRGTKQWLIEDGLRALSQKNRRKLARDLLLGGRVTLPEGWLDTRQRAFLALLPHEIPNAATRVAGADLLGRVVHLCDQLIPRLIDDFLARHPLDPDARRRLRRRAPLLVRDALLRTSPSWPSADVEGFRAAVDEALTGRAGQAPAAVGHGLLIRPHERPADRNDLREKVITRATSDEALSRRYHRFLWAEEVRHAFRVAVALVPAGAIAILYLALFEALRHIEPDLPVREAALVSGAAIGAALGGTGLGMLRDRLGRARSGNEPPQPPRSGGEDPDRP
jgi:hypothetical protein